MGKAASPDHTYPHIKTHKQAKSMTYVFLVGVRIKTKNTKKTKNLPLLTPNIWYNLPLLTPK